MGRLFALVAESSGESPSAELNALGRAMQEELGILVSGCRMTGPGHDQLHILLEEIFPRVTLLQSAAEPNALRETWWELMKLSGEYSRYFE